jgi:hypothetical protein
MYKNNSPLKVESKAYKRNHMIEILKNNISLTIMTISNDVSQRIEGVFRSRDRQNKPTDKGDKRLETIVERADQ